MIAHDIEIVKGKAKYRVSNNPFTDNALRVVNYDVQGAGYDRDFQDVDRIQGRFLMSEREVSKIVSLKLSYSVDRMARVTELKSELQNLFSGHFYLRELSAPSTEIQFESFSNTKPQEFELEYSDGRQIYVGLSNNISIDTTQTYGEIELEFETVELPYFESIGYNTDLQIPSKRGLWGTDDDAPWSVSDKYRKYIFDNVQDGYFYYLGDVKVDQFNQDYEIKIVLTKPTNMLTFYIGNEDMTIINGINLKGGDVIKFDGFRIYRNDLPIDEKTNGVQPVIKPGANNFHCNQEMQQISFKTKFYYR